MDSYELVLIGPGDKPQSAANLHSGQFGLIIHLGKTKQTHERGRINLKWSP